VIANVAVAERFSQVNEPIPCCNFHQAAALHSPLISSAQGATDFVDLSATNFVIDLLIAL
jgi:hypothetical protein